MLFWQSQHNSILKWACHPVSGTIDQELGHKFGHGQTWNNRKGKKRGYITVTPTDV